MKVLWFVNIALPEYVAVRGGRAVTSGGWMEAMITSIKEYTPEIKLFVAFIGDSVDRISVNGVTYFSLGKSCGVDFERQVALCVEFVKPDVIHIHGTEVIAQVLPNFVFSAAPVVLSIQGIMAECGKCFMGGLSSDILEPHIGFLRRILNKNRLCDVATQWQNRLAAREVEICRKVKYFIGRTNFDKKWIESINPTASYYHLNEIMRTIFYKGPRSISKIKKYTIFSNSIFSYPLKGGHLLLDALLEIKVRNPSVQLRVAAGEVCNPQEWLRRVKRNEYHRYIYSKIKETGLQNNIVLLPSLTASEVRTELERAEVFCLPSTMENSSNSLVEAQLAGVPTVVSNTGGCASVFSNSAAGYLVDSKNVRQLARAICNIFEDSRHWQTIAQSSVKHLQCIHSREKISLALVDIYRVVMKAV